MKKGFAQVAGVIKEGFRPIMVRGGDGLPISGLGLVCPLGVGAAPSVWAVWEGRRGIFAPTPFFVVRSPFDSNLLNQAADSMSFALVLHLDLIDQYTEDAAGRSGGLR